MTIEQLGSIGELVAATATVVTLIYLAIQIRANTTALRVESRRSEMAVTVPVFSSIIENPEVAKLFRAGLEDPSVLSADDYLRFSLLLGQQVGAEAAHYDEVLLGLSSRDTLKRRGKTLATFLNTPGGRQFWGVFADQYPDEFQAYVEKDVF